MENTVSLFQRRISPVERLYFTGRKVASPFVIQIFVEGDGEIALQDLQSAVEKASASCPGSRLTAQGRFWKDCGQTPPVREIQQCSFDGYGFDAIQDLKRSLDPHLGPTCEVLLIRGKLTTVIFRAFHGVMDGKGVLWWMEDVFRALRKEEPRGADSARMDADLLEELGAKARRKVELDSPFPLRLGTGPVTGTHSFFWKRRTIPGVHPALAAKISSVVSAFSVHQRIRAMVPVDLRRHDPLLQSTANLSLPIMLDLQKGEAWESIQKTLLTSLSKKQELAYDGSEWALSNLPYWAMESLVRAGIEFQNRRRVYLASAIVSHLGKVELNTFSGAGFSARTIYSLPVHAGFVPLSFVAVECPGDVELTLSSAEGKGLEQEAEKLLDQITETLTPSHGPRWIKESTNRPFPSNQTFIQLFHERVKLSPNRSALVWTSVMTYAELDCRANTVAHLLRERGVKAGSIVGLMASRTPQVIVGLFGILKTGAAYLPLDPQYPDERIRFMLEDSGTTICLTGEEHSAEQSTNRLASIFGHEVLSLGQIDFSTIFPDVEPGTQAGDLAYLIYTSGSSGRPKGVQIENRSLVNYLSWAIDAYQIHEDTRFALFTSLAFDLSVTSLLLPLLCGGSVELFPEELNHLTLKRIVEGGEVNALKLTPTHLEMISRLKLNPNGVQIIVVGGEQLKGSVAARAQEMFGLECRIINEYGPTETTVGCLAHEFNPLMDGPLSPVPIGLPISNIQVFLMDPQGSPVGVGEMGELFFGGSGLARGYLNREELNQEKFVSFANGERAYRTGDLARVLDTGELEFLGRLDDQLKIKGHRIEPGEVETVLLENSKIASAAVIGRVLSEGSDPLLCAYFVPRANVTEKELRSELERKLPRYLVPSFFIELKSIPITVNGKVDVQALPSPTFDLTRFEPSVLDEVERSVAQVWAKVLIVSIENIETKSHFYHLGGDSLKMAEMLSAVADGIIIRSHEKDFREKKFMEQLHLIIRDPTLENVSRAVRWANEP